MSYLEDKIKKASQKYYSGEDSGLTDVEFDRYMNKYREENPDGELLNKVGHGYDVNLDTTPGEKVKHKYGKAGSLDKVYTWKDFNNRLAYGNELHASLKLDGLSIVLYYNNGKLVQAVTRGDGFIGIDVTNKINVIFHDFLTIKDNKFTGAVRGEIIMTKENFSIYSEIHTEAKNPRNTAAGLINSKEVSEELNLLDIYVYTVVGLVSNYVGLNRRVIQSWLNTNFGNNVAPYDYVSWLDESNYLDEMNRLKNMWNELDIPSDGIVLSDIEATYHEESNEVEYYMQAFKFQSETAESTVTKIEWALTKNRRLVPTIVCEPVELSGTTVQRATGYNAKYIVDNKIDSGAVVEVEKHGEIIPNVNKVLKQAEYFTFPKTCPRCNKKLDWQGVDLICKNEDCNNAVEQDTLMWLKHLVPTDGMGDTLILKFLNQFYSDDISIENIMNSRVIIHGDRAGTQLRLFHKMMDRLYLDNFKLKDALQALNIPRLGEITSDKLSKHPSIVKDVLEASDTEDIFYMLRGVLGEADSVSITMHIEKFRRLNLIKDRIIWDDFTQAEIVHRQKVAVTGKLSVSRKQFECELLAAGFIIADVSKDTKYLITDNPNSNSSKNQKADKLGIHKLTEEEFRNMYNI